MCAQYTGQLVTDHIVSAAGRTFPTNASIKPDGTAFVPTIAAVATGSDTYRVTFTPTTAGVWRFDVTDSAGDQWVQVYDVVASVPAFTRVINLQTVVDSHINDLQAAIEALRS